MKKIKARYWVSLVLSFLCIVMIYDTASVFPDDLYAIFVGQAIDIPLGIISVMVSAFISKKETGVENWKKYVTLAGVILGLITVVLPIILYRIGMALR